MESARQRLRLQARPVGSLGRLDDLAVDIAGMFDDSHPERPRIKVAVMCSDHGVASEMVSVFPQKITKDISSAFLEGGTAFNIFAEHVGAATEVVDCGIIGELPEHPRLVRRKIRNGTHNIAKGPAMTTAEAQQSLNIGIETAAEAYRSGFKVLAVGEIGNSNTTAAAALSCGLSGIPPAATVGKGTGVPPWQKLHKLNVVTSALTVNTIDASDPMSCLQALGGFEIGAMAGAIIGAASYRMCVVVDGFISTVSALLAARLVPAARQYMVFAHRTMEPGHELILRLLDAKPLLTLELQLGEGTGAILGASLVQLSCSILSSHASFTTLDTTNPYLG